MGKVLILQNAPLFTAGHFEQELQRREIPFEYRKVYEQGMPGVEQINAYSGYIVLGGPLKFRVEQPEKSQNLSKQIYFLRAALEAHQPVLAVGQGALLLAQAQGAWVDRAPEKEVGWISAEIYPDYSRNSVIYSPLLEQRKKIPALVWYDAFHGFPPQGYWYVYGKGCRYLSTGIHGNCYLFNFHPEATPAMVDSWLREHAQEVGDQAEQIRAGAVEHEEFNRVFCRGIVHGFQSFLRD